MPSARPRLSPGASCGKEPLGVCAKAERQAAVTAATAAANRADRIMFIDSSFRLDVVQLAKHSGYKDYVCVPTVRVTYIYSNAGLFQYNLVL
jgi:hypothetical protein